MSSTDALAWDERTMREKVKEIIIKSLSLDVKPEDVTDTAPLFFEGLGLDSIDSLEIVIGLEDHFKIKVTEDDISYFYSVATLAEMVRDKLRAAQPAPEAGGVAGV